MPFRCRYCGGSFCSEHRIPEMHQCFGIRLAPSPDRVRSYKPYEDTLGVRTRGFSWGRSEFLHLVASAALVGLAGLSLTGWAPGDLQTATVLLTGFVASFLGHELMHKVTAMKRGFAAFFRVYLAGALVTLLTAILPIPFKVIMPGAVVFSGPAGPRDVGLISLAGPLFNLLLAISLTLSKIATGLWVLGVLGQFNLFLAFFNLLPIQPLDGEKVFRWSVKIWAAVFLSTLVLMVLTRLV